MQIPFWRKPIFHETCLILGLLILHLWHYSVLFSSKVTLSHDNLFWNFPTALYYFRNLSGGHLPLFNFLSRFGEPFLPQAMQMRLLDPIESLWGVLVWKVFGDEVLAYNFFRYSIQLTQCFLIYLLFRKRCSHLWVKGTLFASACFGSIFLASMHQDGMLNEFLWVPLIVICMDKFLLPTKAGANTFGLLAMGVLVGSSLQSYFFIATVTFCLLYLVLNCLKNPADFSAKVLAKRMLIAGIPVVLMTAPNILVLQESKSWVYPARSTALPDRPILEISPFRVKSAMDQESGLVADESTRQNLGTRTSPWDLVQVLSPRGNSWMASDKEWNFGKANETYFFLGLVPFILGIIGMVKAKNREAFIWLNLFSFFLLFAMGQEIPWFYAITEHIPLFPLLRNRHGLIIFCEFAFLYFVTIGGNWVSEILND